METGNPSDRIKSFEACTFAMMTDELEEGYGGALRSMSSEALSRRKREKMKSVRDGSKGVSRDRQRPTTPRSRSACRTPKRRSGRNAPSGWSRIPSTCSGSVRLEGWAAAQDASSSRTSSLSSHK